jgi:hypothetical protein
VSQKFAASPTWIDKSVMGDKRRKTIKTTVAPARLVETAELRHQRIADRAYERFVARGCMHGHDIEDWLAAEAEHGSR